MMNFRWCACGLISLGATLCPPGHAQDWPTSKTFDNGVEVGASGIFQYDWNAFGHDRQADGSHLFDDSQDWRRQELDLFVKKQGAFEIAAGYDFAGDAWVDNYLALESKAGKFQLGEFRTPVGWESATTSGRANTFIEAGLPVEMAYEGRRAGLGWSWTGVPHWSLQLAWFAPHDLNHDGAGRTLAGRAVFAPIARADEVVHLGLSVSQENRDDGSAQVRTRPEAKLTPLRLVDTGTLADVDHINRDGLEAAWMNGPLLLQGEYLAMHVARNTARRFDSHGYYVSAAWMLTGESHGYKETAFGNPVPSRPAGALEVAMRYSTVDLDDGGIEGGTEHDWTLGLNWYISKHFKLQANAVRAFSDRGNLEVDPHIYELLAQLDF